MIRLFVLLVASFNCVAGSNNELIIDSQNGAVLAAQKDRTRFVEASVRAKASTNDSDVDYIKFHLAYDLNCEHELTGIKEKRTSENIPNPYWFSGFTTFYILSNKTSDVQNHNGYQMFKTYKWLTQNPTDFALCQLRYQAKAGFSDNPITVNVGAFNLPITAAFTTTKGDEVSAMSSRTFKMLPPVNPGDGGGGEGCIAHCTPLIIDLGHDGITLGRWGVGVEFDMLGNGSPLTMQWVKPNGNEAFLIHDINRNGIADDGRELFGSGTFMIEDGSDSYQAPNGFVALAQFDTLPLGGDNDGFITDSDSIWLYLSLWLDRNADGVSESNEILSLEQMGIDKLSIIPKSSNQTDNAGNLLPFWSWVYGEHKLKMVDVFFRLL